MQCRQFFIVAFLSLVAAGLVGGCAPAGGQARLAYVAKKDAHSGVRKSALDSMTDQALIADVAKHSKYPQTRLLAAQRLDEDHQAVAQATFAELARKNNKDTLAGTEIRRTAVHHLTDPKHLAKVAKKADDAYVRSVAVQKLAILNAQRD